MLLSDTYAAAMTYAAAAHDGQTRKGTDIPYISHPVAVSALVIENGGSETQAIAALLHDVLEDCGEHHAALIAARFGNAVLHIVRGLTDGVPGENGRKPQWRSRKIAYLRHLGEADLETVLVSACDKLHNARAIADDHDALGEAVFHRFAQPRGDVAWYYRSLQRVLTERLGSAHRVVRQLGMAVDRWDR